MNISRRILRRWHPRLREFLAQLDESGYHIDRGRKHYIIRDPEGRTVGSLACTPSDHRAQLNVISDVRRAIANQ
tara:strand:+ start:1803 stop:2024 length:222 start_codon:yes stop_codon:yes gene_type:complete